MTWALKRQIFYVGILLLFFAFFGFLIAYPYFNKTPTCFDRKQNGIEAGVDCGGTCALACVATLDEIHVLWSRAFQVVPGRYNAVAYVENSNKNAAVNKIQYVFKFTDKDNFYLGQREGETFVPPGSKFAVFEAGIDVGNGVPVYTTFEFTETPVWFQVSEAKVDELKVLVSDIVLEEETVSPRLSAVVKNSSLFIIPDLAVVAILYDRAGNAVLVSRTALAALKGGESRAINFTWPEPVSETIVFKEIIPIFNIFSTTLK